MALTLSGNGTITGLVAGGLPDGTITGSDIAASTISDGNIANNAVTSGKLASGAAATNLAGSTIPGSLRVSGVFRGGAIWSGQVDTNLTAGQTGYWCLAPVAIQNGFSFIIDVVAESWTVWNVCRIHLRKLLNSSSVQAQIPHQYSKSSVTVSVVTVRVDGVDYVAISRTGQDPAFVATIVAGLQSIQDGFTPFHTRSGSVQSTHATY